MKPTRKRKQYVRLQGAVYEAGELLYPAGQVGRIEDIEEHPWGGKIFILKVRLRSGKLVYVNENATTTVYGP